MALTVLVADPQRMFAEALAVALRGYSELQVAEDHPGSGPELVRAVETHHPHVVVCEYWLEGMKAPATARAILARAPRTTVIAVSWLLGPPQVSDTLKAGVAGFLTKNEPVARLVEGIRRAQTGEWPVFREDLEQLVGRIDTRARFTEHAAELFASLSPRELEVLGLVGSGRDARQIARGLDLTENTVRRYIANILTKTGTHSQIELVSLARDQGLIV